MKKYIALIALIASFSQAETIELETPIQVGGTITAIKVGSVQYDANDNSWFIFAEPVINHPQPIEANGVSANIMLTVRLGIKVQRAEIEAALGISDVGNATVDQLNDTVRGIALNKALAALNP